MKNILGLATKVAVGEFSTLELNEVAPHETVVGILPDNLKQIYILCHQKIEPLLELRKKIIELKNDFVRDHWSGEADKHGHSKCEGQKEEITKLIEQFEKDKAEYDALSEIFWTLVRLEFDLLDADIIAVCKEGKIVRQ
jgi:hypothetical protein